jgi:hypothetical protein
MRFGSSKVTDVYFGNKRVLGVLVGKKRGFYPYSLGVKYTLNDDTLSFSGKSYYVSGLDTTFKGGELKLAKIYKGQPVSNIEANAFWYESNITSVIIQSVGVIGDYAFAFCENLKTVTLPKSVKGIGDNAFRDCKKLTDIYYNGTKAEFNSISKGAGWNSGASFTIRCTNGNI